jgi:biotin carboxyl carrier protein
VIAIKSRVGRWNFTWQTLPRGNMGVAHVEVEGKSIEVRWKKDRDGLWVLFPRGIYGFDLSGEKNDEGRLVFNVSQRNGHSEWINLFASQGAGEAPVANKSAKAKAIRVRGQMPGKIIRVMVQAEQMVEKGQPMLVMEAMKMENEIRAPQAGRVTQVKVTEGQAVETGADLVLIEGS